MLKVNEFVVSHTPDILAVSPGSLGGEEANTDLGWGEVGERKTLGACPRLRARGTRAVLLGFQGSC